MLVIGKRLFEPNRSLVEKQMLVLCVPVAWNLHLRGLVEVVFNQVLGALRLRILEESPSVEVHSVVIVTLLLYIDDVFPVSVQQCCLSCIHVAQQGHLCGLCRSHYGYQRQ